MKIKFWGTRGSIPVPGKNTIRYGGNTPCLEIRTKDNHLIILDAGSGIRELGDHIHKSGYNQDIDIFLTHYHWDHIQGIPFFYPIYSNDYKINFYGISDENKSVKDYLQFQMDSHFFPVKMDEVNKNLEFIEIKSHSTYEIHGLVIETLLTNHPSPTVTFKITKGNKCLVYMTDNEINLESEEGTQTFDELKDKNLSLINFCKGCKYLIHDAMYDEADVFSKKGWGHSSNKSLARFSSLTEIETLILFHYSPDYSDDKIDEIISDTQKELLKNGSGIKCIGAKEGLELEI